MKKISKVLIILIIIFCGIYIYPQNIVNAEQTVKEPTSDGGTEGGISISGIVKGIRPINPSQENYEPFVTVVATILSFLQIISGITMIIMITVFGFEFITDSPANTKEELKKKLLPMLVGVIFVLSATSIAKFIITIT